MGLEVITHLLVIIFIVGDFGYHAFKAWQKRKQNKSKKLYTLNEARVELFPEALEHGNKLCACTGIREEIRRES